MAIANDRSTKARIVNCLILLSRMAYDAGNGWCIKRRFTLEGEPIGSDRDCRHDPGFFFVSTFKSNSFQLNRN
jgi:hypothetical protein